MADPWFEPVWKFGAYYGGVGGSIVGLLGGLFGGVGGGYLVPRGLGRRWVLGGMALMAALGVAHLIVGAYAWWAGQPYGIWYPILLLGMPTTFVFGGLYPVIAARYREAEQRRIDAEGIRTG